MSSRALLEACLERINDPAGEGARTFTLVDAEGARRAADEQDRLRTQGEAPGPLAGIPVSVKDLFDVAGQRTRAGSRVFDDQPVAAADAPAVARLRAAGLVIVGRTQMPEFALSGIGLNALDGTPRAPWRREVGHVPGGSSSGAAVSVADGMAHAALGSDTGGSCRIPAAFCGLVGYKPTATSVPREGMVPLAPSLDSVGPLARSVRCCASLHAVLSGTARPAPMPPAQGMRLGVPQTLVLGGLQEGVARAFERALQTLSRHGVQLVELPMRAFAELPRMHANGSLTGWEALQWHEPWIVRHRERYDPAVLARLQRSAGLTLADVQHLRQQRAAYTAAVAAELAHVDALAMPTCPITPPTLASVADEAGFNAANLAVLRNPTTVNLFDGCAISLPMHAAGEPPTGLMLAQLGGQDAALLGVAETVEQVLNAQPPG